MKKPNLIAKTDSYKLIHWLMYPKGTQYVYSYFESRTGATFDYTVFFGLQYILKRYLSGTVVTQKDIDKIAALSKAHFGSDKYFNRAGWEYVLKQHKGKLPIRIKAVPEGMPVPVSNVMMTVENTDPNCAWLTNVLESLLTHVWYSSVVATQSRACKEMFKEYLDITSDTPGGINFMLHDFGYRGVSSDESAEIGGLAHLVNFLGTDTVPAMVAAVEYYKVNPDFTGIAYSVPASEHSVMTALGPEGEADIVSQLLDTFPTGILSVVADSYDIYNFVENIVGKQLKDRILKRDGVFVVRPDSVTPQHPYPEQEVVWILNSLWQTIGGVVNKKGYKVLNPKVRVLWGDGLDIADIENILDYVKDEGFSVENLVFGMGGGLLQKVNRDTQRSAFKSSAQCRNGIWFDIFKKPKDERKASKKGRLKLVWQEGAHGKAMVTVPFDDPREDLLVTVFENGKILKTYTLEEIRKNAEIR